MGAIKKIVAWLLLIVFGLLLLLVGGVAAIYYTRLGSVSTIKKISAYADGYNLYSMDVQYEYDLDEIIQANVDSDQEVFDIIVKKALPYLPIQVSVPSFGCTAFRMVGTDDQQRMGRNYDFRYDTSAMLVHCSPKDGYKSVAFAALDNVSANDPESGIKSKLAALTSPFICLDGMNEKGVSIAVLVVDSEPVHQNTDKGNIFTTLAIRLVLDRAATTEEAVQLLKNYDMIATSGKDYHFYVNDASGDGRILEYDCESETRELVATPIDVATNFYALYADKVLPNQKNGIYGHGKERYEAVLDVFDAQKDAMTNDTAWDALKATAQTADGGLTSNTQWSIVFNNTDLTAQIVLRRNWSDVFTYRLQENAIA